MIMKQDLSFSEEKWYSYDHFQSIREVLEGLLNKNPDKRKSAKKALEHHLFKLAKMDMRDVNFTLLKDNINFNHKKVT